jgi:exopolyphosphatase/guanosine-5'-triphosphate,3'-diphosphate pyrophosphatase
VAATAAKLLDQCKKEWRLESELAARMLDWAARLHEIGLDISHDGFQRHGAYIAENADMPGFPWTEQRVLAVLIASQRRAINRRAFRLLPSNWRQRGLRLALLLRLAVLLNRSRNSEPLPDIGVQVKRNSVTVKFPQYWLADNPLTVADIEREQEYLRQVNYDLQIRDSA